mgnify:CR=1 FL=1
MVAAAAVVVVTAASPVTVVVVLAAEPAPMTPRSANLLAESGLAISVSLGTTAIANTMPLLLKRRLRKSVTLSKNSPVVKSFHTREAVELTGTEFELLAMLAAAPGKVFSRDDILEKLRGRSAEDIHSRAVDILVSRLRRKLEPLDCIHTLRNAGYRFAGVRA